MHFHDFVYICICIYSWRILLNKFFKKQLCRSLFFNKAADVKPGILFKKRPRHSCFPLNFEKSLEIHHWTHLVVVSHNYSFFPQNFEILTLKSASLFLRDLLTKIMRLLLNIFKNQNISPVIRDKDHSFLKRVYLVLINLKILNFIYEDASTIKII